MQFPYYYTPVAGNYSPAERDAMFAKIQNADTPGNLASFNYVSNKLPENYVKFTGLGFLGEGYVEYTGETVVITITTPAQMNAITNVNFASLIILVNGQWYYPQNATIVNQTANKVSLRLTFASGVILTPNALVLPALDMGDPNAMLELIAS